MATDPKTAQTDVQAQLRAKYAPMLAKYRWLSLILYAVIAVVGSFVFFRTAHNSSYEFKKYDLERLLQIERMHLENIVNKELALILNMASSPIIQQYFGNPNDQELARVARREIEAHRNMLFGSFFMINDIDKMFYINDLPPYRLYPEKPENYWYNMTLHQTETYNFNINYNPDIRMTNLWINAPVMGPDGTPVGLLGAGIDLKKFIISVYEQQNNMRYNNFSQRTKLYFFNRNEEITGALDITLVSNKSNIRTVLGDAGQDLVDAANALDENGFSVFASPVGLVAVYHIPLLDWFVAGIISPSIQDYINPVTIFFFILLVLIAAIIILSNIVIARLLKPLQKNMLSLETALRAKTNFLAKMSHEIRTPMNAIIGMSELALREEGMTPNAYNQLRTINQAGTNLLSIINDILDLSKIENEKLEIIPDTYLFNSLVNDVISIINVRLADTNISFAVNIGNNIPCELTGDVVRIRQVLLNVLTNAVKYTKEGYISLTITNEYTDEKSCVLTFCVEDSGIGIKDEDVNKVFGDFIQVDQKNNKWTEGTGLGLAITKSLVKAMGGEITVNSEYGKGSTFTVTLPQTFEKTELFEFSASVNTANTNAAIDEPGYYNREKRNNIKQFIAPDAHVLVVDDNAPNLMITEGLLGQYKVKVDLQNSGQGAINAVRKNAYDIVFMDHMMPEKDGIETTREIRSFEGEEYQKLPIIALTANTVAGAKEMFLENGFNDFLSKPMDLTKLNSLLLKWIPKHKQQFGYAQAANDKNDIGLQIPNVDVQKGVSMTGGLENYLRAIEIFCDDTQRKLCDINEARTNADYNRYGIYVHAIKSAAANIGAADISEKAMQLEAAAKRNDATFINSAHNAFMTGIEVLISDLRYALSKQSGESNADITKNPENLKTALRKLADAINAMDGTAIDNETEILREFSKLSGVSAAGVNKIADDVFTGDYESALLRINVLSEELS